MAAAGEAPVELVESVAVRFPPNADARLRRLMDRHTAGQPTADGRAGLAGRSQRQ